MYNNKLSALVVATLTLCSADAHADTIISKDSTGSVINSQLTIAGTSYSVDWYLPNANASGLVTVQHGFSRGCGNLRDTSKRIMANGLIVLCVNANMSGGNPALAEALGNALINRNVTTPDGHFPKWPAPCLRRDIQRRHLQQLQQCLRRTQTNTQLRRVQRT